MHAFLDRVSMAPGTGCQNEYTPRRGRNKSTREILQLGASNITRGVPYQSMVHPHLFCLGELPSCFSEKNKSKKAKL